MAMLEAAQTISLRVYFVNPVVRLGMSSPVVINLKQHAKPVNSHPLHVLEFYVTPTPIRRMEIVARAQMYLLLAQHVNPHAMLDMRFQVQPHVLMASYLLLHA